MISLRNSMSNMCPEIDLEKGLKESIVQYQAVYSKDIAFPSQSMRAICNSSRWPRKLIKTAEYPKNKQTGWCDNLNGVACDGDFWYFSEQHKRHHVVSMFKSTTDNTLWKIPISWDLGKKIDRENPPRAIKKGSRPNVLNKYSHYSDLDVVDDYIFLSMEGAGVGKVGIFNKENLDLIGSIDLDEQNPKAPWVAVRKSSNSYIAFSTRFGDNPADGDYVDRVFMYEIKIDLSSSEKVTRNYLGYLKLKDKTGQTLKLDRIQGGTITPNGHLYLISDKHKNGGIFGFNLYTGILGIRYKIDIKEVGAVRRLEELEGMCYFPLNNRSLPGGINGHLHVPMLNKEVFGTDYIYIKHYSSPVGEEQWI